MILQISSQNLASGLSLLGTTSVQLGNIYVEFICANYLYEILIKVLTMCSKNMNDEEGYDETRWNDILKKKGILYLLQRSKLCSKIWSGLYILK